MSIRTQIFPSARREMRRWQEMDVLHNAVLLSRPVLWKAERDADGNVDAHSARASVRGAHSQSRRRAHRRCDDAK
jgi:hypothetical protein